MGFVSRRDFFGFGLGGGVVAVGGLGCGVPGEAGMKKGNVVGGRLRQSIAQWCFAEYWDLERMCGVAKELGCESVELVDVKGWGVLKRHGLVCAMAGSHWFDKGMNNPEYHAMCTGKIREAIDACAAAGMRNCVQGYKRVIGYAERKGVNVCLEMLNSRVAVEMVGVPGYQGHHTDYCMEIVRRVGSERMKLLFDIFHVQIMDGDLIRRIRQYADYIGHYHAAGNFRQNLLRVGRQWL